MLSEKLNKELEGLQYRVIQLEFQICKGCSLDAKRDREIVKKLRKRMKEIIITDLEENTISLTETLKRFSKICLPNNNLEGGNSD